MLVKNKIINKIVYKTINYVTKKNDIVILPLIKKNPIPYLIYCVMNRITIYRSW